MTGNSSIVRGMSSSSVSAIGDALGRRRAVAVVMAAVNLSGRFNANAAKSYGEELIAGLLTHQQLDLFFGQQAATKVGYFCTLGLDNSSG